MELFKGRTMAIAGISALSVAAVGWFINGTLKQALAVSFLLAFFVFVFLRILNKISTAAMLRGAVCCVVSICVLLRAFFYFDRNYLSMEKYQNEYHVFTAVPMSRIYSGTFYDKLKIKITSVDGEVFSTYAELECEYASDIQPGQLIAFYMCSEPFEKNSFLNNEQRALSEGIFLRFVSENENDITYLSEECEQDTLSVFFKRLNSSLSFFLSDGIGGTAGKLASAMLLGNGDELPTYLTRDFSRCGISHLLALSGLHISIVTGAVGLLLSRLKIPVIIKVLVLSAFIMFYLALIGFIISAVRASIMLIMIFTAYFFGADEDGVSSLFVASTLILCISPGAIVDLGFLLSVAATFGIVVFLPYFNRWTSRLLQKYKNTAGFKFQIASFCAKVSALLLTCLSANCFSLILVWCFFGEISLVFPISNLFLTPLAAPFLILSILFIPLGNIPLVGRMISFLISLIARVLINTSYALSDIHGVVISLKYDFAAYLIVAFTVIMAILVIVKLKHKSLLALPGAVMVIAFAACLLLSGNADPHGKVNYACVNDGTNDVLILTSYGKSVICDIGDGSYYPLSIARSVSKSMYATECEALILTHYHIKHTKSVERFISEEKVRRIWMPKPLNKSETEISASVFESASLHGVECFFYAENELLTAFGEVKIGAVRSYISRSTHPVVRMYFDLGKRGGNSQTAEYIGASAWDSGKTSWLLTGDTYIFGSHGPKIKNAVSIKSEFPPTSCIILDQTILDAINTRELFLNDANGTEIFLFPELWRNAFPKATDK